MFLAKATTLNSKKEVQGDLVTDFLYEDELYGYPEGNYTLIYEGLNKVWPVDPNSVKLSVDGGLTWYSQDFFEEKLKEINE